MIPAAFALASIVLFVAVPLARAEDIAQPVPPGEECSTLADTDRWTIQELFVWRRVCIGGEANFNTEAGYGGALDPKNPEGWRENRILSPTFLETILLGDKYRRALTRRGVQIVGARFTETIDLANAVLRHELRLKGSLIEKGANLSGVRSSHSISFDNSKVSELLNMNGLQVDANVFLRHAELSTVGFNGARVASELSLLGSSVTGTIGFDQVRVGQNLNMRMATFKGTVWLSGAHVSNQLLLHGAKVFGDFEAESVEAEEGIYLKDGAEFHGPIFLDFVKTGILELGGATFYQEVNITGGHIGSELRLVSLTYKRPQLSPPQWKDDAILVLRNVTADAIQDLPDAWPKKLDLTGFVYRGLGGIFGPDPYSKSNLNTDLSNRDVSWLKEWLSRQQRYTQQPYEQLASVLRNYGRPGAADEVLYAGRERERANASSWRYAWLTILKCSIGYGYAIWRALFWVLLLLIFGFVTLQVTDEGRKNGMPYGIAYSFDMLLPIIQLKKSHYEITLNGFARYYFYAHKVLGYLLASFLIVGLAGLTK